MIIDCEAAVFIPSHSARFSRSKVGIAYDSANDSHFLVVVRATDRDRFRLSSSNVKIFRASFQFHSPHRCVMLRDGHEHQLQKFKMLIRKIVDNRVPIPKFPNIERILQLKPLPVALSLIGSSQAELKKLQNKCLKTISLTEIIKIPAEIWTMKNLATLKLPNCSIRRIPRELHQLNESLIHLSLCNNQIEEIPMWFCKRMRNLKILDLSRNRLKSLPFEMVLLKSCKSFDFSHNRIRNLPSPFSLKIFSSSQVYDKVNFSYNNLNFLYANDPPFGVSNLISEIDLSHNRFQDDLSNIITRLDLLVKRCNETSLFTLALEKVITNQHLLRKMFVDTTTPKPIYQTLQELIFLCYSCRRLRIRLAQYTFSTNMFLLPNFANQYIIDCSSSAISTLYLFCSSCSRG